jgi:UDP-N-acetylmuramyl pentapeptide synthase
VSLQIRPLNARDRRRSRAAALYRRLLIGRPFVGITGSVAKTTTTKLIGDVLAALGPGHASGLGGNAGPHIPRAVLATRPLHRYCVQEISGHEPGALDEPLAVFRPNIGVVTWVGMDHWRAFGDPAGIAKEKSKMVACLPAGGCAVLNADDPAVLAMAARTRARVVKFGLSPQADVRATDVRCSFPDRLSMTIRHAGRSLPLRTGLIGEHMAHPVLAAIAVGLACGVPLAECVRRLDGVLGRRHRMTAHQVPSGATFLLDTRKAPVWTVEASLRVLEQARARRKVAVIGTLSDYRGAAEKPYRKVARRALEIADRVYFVGAAAQRARKEAPTAGDREFRLFDTVFELHTFLHGRLGPGDLMLVKGSRIDHLERLLEARVGPHACWRVRCGVRGTCTDCKQRFTPAAPEAIANGPHDPAR